MENERRRALPLLTIDSPFLCPRRKMQTRRSPKSHTQGCHPPLLVAPVGCTKVIPAPMKPRVNGLPHATLPERAVMETNFLQDALLGEKGPQRLAFFAATFRAKEEVAAGRFLHGASHSGLVSPSTGSNHPDAIQHFVGGAVSIFSCKKVRMAWPKWINPRLWAKYTLHIA